MPQKHSLIVGSAPVSKSLQTADLSMYTRISINKSWQLRPDFDFHVGLKHKVANAAPPDDYPAQRIRPWHYKADIRQAGGGFLTSASVALYAGYWAIGNTNHETITYYGCDLVFPKEKSHFYGNSDQGPLAIAHPANRYPKLRATRLFAWGLFHRVSILNGSGVQGTLLCFPISPTFEGRDEVNARILRSPYSKKIMETAGNAFAFENIHQAEFANLRWAEFASNLDAVKTLESCMEKWRPVHDLCLELREKGL